jgi:hypothetical protein
MHTKLHLGSCYALKKLPNPKQQHNPNPILLGPNQSNPKKSKISMDAWFLSILVAWFFSSLFAFNN